MKTHKLLASQHYDTDMLPSNQLWRIENSVLTKSELKRTFSRLRYEYLMEGSFHVSSKLHKNNFVKRRKSTDKIRAS